MKVAKREISPKEAAKEVEAVLFSSGRWMDIQELSKICRIKEGTIKEALGILKQKYSREDTALKLRFDNNKWKLSVKNEYSESVKKVVSGIELSKTVVETLAVIAWKAPVLQSDIIKMRTNKAYDDIAFLKDEGFITKEKHGRTYLIRLAKKFFDYFEVDNNKGLKTILNRMEEKEEPKNEIKIIDEKVYDNKKQDSQNEDNQEQKSQEHGNQANNDNLNKDKQVPAGSTKEKTDGKKEVHLNENTMESNDKADESNDKSEQEETGQSKAGETNSRDNSNNDGDFNKENHKESDETPAESDEKQSQ